MSTIKTQWQMSGEKEYKAALTDINRNITVLNSEMKKVSAVYADNASSVEALAAKQSVLDRTMDEQRRKVEQTRAALESAAAAYGEGDKRVSAWQIKLNTAEAQLARTELAVRKNKEELEAANKTTEEAAEKTGDLAEAQEKADADSKGLGDAVSALSSKLGIQLPSGANSALNGLVKLDAGTVALATSLAAVASAIIVVEDKLIGITRDAATFADDILTTATTTGIAAEKLQEYSYAAELLDVSVDTITGSQTKLIRSMQQAADGAEKQADAFAQLGVSYTNADGSLRDVEDVFWDAIDALGRMENETERDSAAMELLGKSARDLNPLIIAGRDAMNELAQEAHDVGYVLDKEQLAALGRVDDAYQRLNNTVEATKNQIGAEFSPALEEATTNSTEFVKQTGDAFRKTGLTQSFASILTSASGLLVPLGSLATTLSGPLKFALTYTAGGLAVIADTLTTIVGLVGFIPELISGKKLKDTTLLTGLGLGNSPSAWERFTMSRSGSYYNYGTNSYYTGGEINYGNYEIDVANGLFSGSYSDYMAAKRAEYGWNAPGTRNWRGGLTWVGENGPELVNLPRGSTVTSAQESRMAGGDTFNITISAKDVREFNDVVEIAQTARMRARKVTG